MIVLSDEALEEGRMACIHNDPTNPYHETSAEGISWHHGWLEAAGIKTPHELRVYLVEIWMGSRDEPQD